MKKLRPVRRITPEEALVDIQPTPAPDGIPQQRWNLGMPQGKREGKALGWYRGHQAGVHDSYMTLKNRHPKAAKDLILAFRMDAKTGTIRL